MVEMAFRRDPLVFCAVDATVERDGGLGTFPLAFETSSVFSITSNAFHS